MITVDIDLSILKVRPSQPDESDISTSYPRFSKQGNACHACSFYLELIMVPSRRHGRTYIGCERGLRNSTGPRYKTRSSWENANRCRNQSRLNLA